MSVVICTFNRAAVLDDALRSFAGITKPVDVAFELLVVDNNSADETRSVVGKWTDCCSFPVRYVYEARQGLSHARNRAVTEAAGEWIWYVDDDVYFSPQWLVAAIDGMKHFPGAAVLAGRVIPVFEPVAPSWLPASSLPYYGLTPFGDEARWLRPTEYPVGANTAFRRPLFGTAGLFRTDLGRIGDSLLSGEEIDMVLRVVENGDAVGYVPDAALRHRVAAERMTMTWLRRRAYWGGVSHVLAVETRRARDRWDLLSRATRMTLRAGRCTLSGLNLDSQIEGVFCFGTAVQCWREVLRRRRPGSLGSSG